MQPIPTGTVAFLFTDVVGSTRLWDEAGDAMAVALAVHDRILREAIDAQTGYVFSTAGDGFAAAFPTPEQATRAAIEAQTVLQRKLGAESDDSAVRVEVRMGIHVGAVEERDGDYFGPALNRAARLMGMAHGGQILVSNVVAGLLRDHAPVGITTRDLGVHHLRGLHEPERVHQLVTPGLRSSFAAIASPELAGNLPPAATSFIGRVQELKALGAELNPRRLVTLTGPGGVGKTRLAVEAAWAARDEFPGGVWIVELAPLSQPEAVVHTLAQTLGPRIQDGGDLVEAVIETIRGSVLLVVLDNCEHVIGAAAEVTSRLLAAASGLALVATSREPLGVRGEHVWPVKPLDPAMEGVELFRERAIAADPSYALGEDDESVARLCGRLDGIPLAIELAAARIRSMTPADLLARLDDRFRLLRGGRDAEARHATLRATVEWSYQLLGGPERDLFDQLSVFAGTFDLPTVEQVCIPEGGDPIEVLEALTALVDKSLVEASRTSGTVRYRLLETLRQYAAEQLAASGLEAETQLRHRRHYLAVAERARADFEGRANAAGAHTFDDEWDNLRVAHFGALAAGDSPAAGRLVDALQWYAHHHLRDELGSWARQAIGLPDASPLAFGVASVMALLGGEYETSIALGLAGCERASEPTAAETFNCWHGSSSSMWFGGSMTDAYDYGQRLVASASGRGSTFDLASALAMFCLQAAGPAPDRVTELAGKARSLAATLANPALDAWVDCNLAPAEYTTGDRAGALAAWRRALAAGALASPFIEAVVSMSLASVAQSGDGATSPETAYRDAIERLFALRAWPHLWIAVESLATYWLGAGREEQAGVVIGYLDANGRRSVNLARRRSGAAARLAELPEAPAWQSRGRSLDREALLAYVREQLDLQAGGAPS